MDASVLDHPEGAWRQNLLINSLQAAIIREHMQPFGIKQIDLPRVLAKRGEPGGIGRIVKRGADTFVRIQLHLRRRQSGAPVGTPRNLLAFFSRLLLLGFLQRVIWMFLEFEERPLQRFAT